jgi:hypothetical protein
MRDAGSAALRCRDGALPLTRVCVQAALGDKPGDEPAAVCLEVDGKESFIGTLRKGKCDQFSVRAPRARRTRAVLPPRGNAHARRTKAPTAA